MLDIRDDPDKTASQYLASRFRSALGNNLPTWLEFPDASKVVIFSDLKSRMRREFFVFDEQPTVFVIIGVD